MGVNTTKAGSLKLASSKVPAPIQTKPTPSGSVSVQGGQSSNDVVEMVEEIGLAVATGLIPLVAQGINIYDTVECLLTLRNSKNPAERMEAKFDLVLALVGWIPGAGGGVKKTIRIVNKHPDRYAPILFDVLRMVLAKLGIPTSPEVLLEQLFDAVGLTALLQTVQTAIEESWLYEKMPSEGQFALSASMSMVAAEMPGMVLIVATKLTHWKTKQRNNAAHPPSLEKKSPSDPKPGKLDKGTATKGTNDPNHAISNAVTNARIGVRDLAIFTKTVTGILGEHITDYHLLENYKWGRDWTRHDIGNKGAWKVSPDIENFGKLNDDTKLNKLFPDRARGKGIDGVWRVSPEHAHTRKMKYAVVESKASVVCEEWHGNGKPPIDGKLGHNKERVEVLLEPDTCALATAPPSDKTATAAPNKPADDATHPPKVSLTKPVEKKVSVIKHARRLSTKQAPPLKERRVKPTKVERVQMSRVWIAMNLERAVGFDLNVDILLQGYARHLFYTPFYLDSAKQHADAIENNKKDDHDAHTDHMIREDHCYDEDEIRAAVNRKNLLLGIKGIEL